MRSITIGTHSIGDGNRPLIITEIAPSQDQSLKRALEIIDAAAAAGAQGIKIRTCNPTRRSASPTGVDADNVDSISDAILTAEVENTKSQAIIQEIPREWHRPILERCLKHDMICIGSPADIDSVAFLEALDVPCYKIDTQNNQAFELISKVAATGKPVVVSTGDIELPDLVKSVAAVKNVGSTKLVLMKSSNPDPMTSAPANINTLPHMQHLFSCMVGLSDHSRGAGAAIASVAIGATIIEKQLTLSRAEDGTNSLCALEPHELKKLVSDTHSAWQALGSVHYGPAQAADNQANSQPQAATSSNTHSSDTGKGSEVKEADAAEAMIPLDNIHAIRPAQGPPAEQPDRH